jgi:tRNA(Arg) A34 adenosine deaminase TadA
MRVDQLMAMARAVATSRTDKRGYLVGAVGIRHDGVIVQSSNGASPHRHWMSHAEARLLKKLGYGSTLVVVVRVKKGSGALGSARPCRKCADALWKMGVKKVVHS